jgi:hypothetical protein
MVTATLWTLAPVFLALALVGGVRNYSIVPFWDAWDGYLNFYTLVTEGHWRQWWALHNEHRIVLARLLFYIDLAWFRGTARFLLVVNYLLVLGAFLTYRSILRKLAGPAAPARAVALVGLFIFMVLFSWVQQKNLVWAFQSQFFLAQWLPLLALYLLYLSDAQPERSRYWFTLACVTGVLCIGTMANGVLALPIMVGYALIQRMGWKRTTVLALLAALCLLAYFAGYQSPVNHGSIGGAAQLNPIKLLQYVLLYIGSPFFYLLGARSLPVGQLFGLVFVLLAVLKAWEYLKSPRQHALASCLLAYLGYFVATALGTGVGRLPFGLAQAATSRYTTPALMGWTALLLLYLPQVIAAVRASRHRFVWPLMVLLAAMLVQQAQATRSKRSQLYEWEVAALALEMGVHDDPQVHLVFYNTEWGLQLSRKPAAANLSAFGLATIRDAGLLVGTVAGALSTEPCRGAIAESHDLPKERLYSAISGWVAPAIGENDISALKLVSDAGVVVGYALAGPPLKVRPAGAQDGPPPRVFKGYVQNAFRYEALTLAPNGARCSVRVQPSQQPAFRLDSVDGSPQSPNVSVGSIRANHGFDGGDFAHSTLPGLKVIGSYGAGDADTGSIVLRLQRGARIFYRAGPTSGRQRFKVDDGTRFAGPLPTVQSWTVLVFDNAQLPAEFDLTLTDEGKGWGEWSAIAVAERP